MVLPAPPLPPCALRCRRNVGRSDSGVEVDLRVAAGGVSAPAARARRAVAAKAAHRTRTDVDFARGDIAAVDLEEGPIAGETRAAGAAGQSVAAGAAPAGRIHRQVPANIDVDRRSRLKRIGHEEARRAAVAVAAGTAGARGVRGPVAAGRSAAEAEIASNVEAAAGVAIAVILEHDLGVAAESIAAGEADSADAAGADGHGSGRGYIAAVDAECGIAAGGFSAQVRAGPAGGAGPDVHRVPRKASPRPGRLRRRPKRRRRRHSRTRRSRQC